MPMTRLGLFGQPIGAHQVPVNGAAFVSERPGLAKLQLGYPGPEIMLLYGLSI